MATIIINTGPDKQWLTWDDGGRITFIDWDAAQALKDAHIAGVRRDAMTAIALVAIGVREQVLESMAEAPKIGAKK